MMLSIQITKFKFRQYQLRAVLPDLMLAKVTRYTVCIFYFLVADDASPCDEAAWCEGDHSDQCRRWTQP